MARKHGMDNPDMITLPERKTEPVSRWNNKLNRPILGNGKLSFSDLTVKGALKIVGPGQSSDLSNLIVTLNQMQDQDLDTVDITVIELDAANKPTYTYMLTSCLLSNFQVDDLNRQTGDDAMCQCTMTFKPGYMKRVIGLQIGANP